MLLENKFFKVLSSERTDDMNATYHVAVLPDCEVYNGHFPGEPVCPGVCNIETIKECACLLTGKNLRYSAIKQCRLTAVATPEVCPEVDVKIALAEAGDAFSLVASIADAKQTYMILKATLI